MDKAKFTVNAPGKLLQIELPVRDSRGMLQRDWSFIPHGLPPHWEFEGALWPLLVAAKEALGTLNGIGQTLPHPRLLLHPLQRREAIASSKIEGTYATPEQLLLYELDPREPKDTNDETAGFQEVFNYNNALQKGCELLKSLPICNRVIKEIHQVLMQGVRGKDKAPGDFRTWQVQIGSTGRFIPPPQDHIDPLMSDLEKYINGDDPKFDPLVKAFFVHYQFEAIHPFGDGNGRVGRLLLALMVQSWLGHSHPWLYLSAYFERYKDEYMANLFHNSTMGAWTEWIGFCLRGTIAQANDAIKSCHEFNRLYKEYHERVKRPTPRTHQIIESLFEHPIITIPSISERCNISYNTSRADIDVLVKANILKEDTRSHPKSFYAYEVLEVAYTEADLL